MDHILIVDFWILSKYHELSVLILKTFIIYIKQPYKFQIEYFSSVKVISELALFGLVFPVRIEAVSY